MRLGNAESAIHHYETAIQFMEKSLGAHKIDKEVLFELGLAYAEQQTLTPLEEMFAERERIRCVVKGSQKELLRRAVELGATEVRTEESSLEEIFLDLVGSQ
ncbi:MAG: hypothetical protein EBX86_06540 [Actinobacteria bacterium]|nr:hypothetical protein [Actinomycetota bacterium]